MNLNLMGKEQNYKFKGAYDHLIELTLYPKYIKDAGHVVVLPFYENQLLLTKHKTRGIEWPGGKVEKDETPFQAGIRELLEETGAHVSSMWLIGQYKVWSESDQYFMKNIYVAIVEKIDDTHYGVDTDGHELFSIELIPSSEAGFSPLITDQVFSLVRKCVLDKC
jgi:8-oxo-dGTP diphosphatase